MGWPVRVVKMMGCIKDLGQFLSTERICSCRSSVEVALTPFGGHGLCGLLNCRGVVAVLHFELDGADLAQG